MWIAPPQFYELSRFCRFPLLNDLHNFSVQRATEGCEQWLPIISKDEHSRPVSLLPGAHSPSYISIEEKKKESKYHYVLSHTSVCCVSFLIIQNYMAVFFYIGYMVDVALWVVLIFIFSMFLSETETEGKNILICFLFFHVTLLHIIARS